MAITTVAGVCNLACSMMGAESVTNVESSASTVEEILCNRLYEAVRDEQLGIAGYNWQFAKTHRMLERAEGYNESYVNSSAQDIAAITQADPCSVTVTSHGYETGWLVRITGVEGMTELNGRVFRITDSGTNTFTLDGINSTNYTAYTSGGQVIRYEGLQKYTDGYVYNVPSDLIKPVNMENDVAWELIGSGNTERILCLEEDPVLIYIKQVTTVSEMPAYFIKLWAYAMAVDMAIPLGKDAATLQNMKALYDIQLNSAKAADSQFLNATHVIRDDSPVLSEAGYADQKDTRTGQESRDFDSEWPTS